MSVLAEAKHNRENLPEQPAAKMQKLEPISTLRIKKLSEHAFLPKRGSAKAAGYDLSRLGGSHT